MPRLLAIDYGTKRTGLAVSDPLQLIANTLATVETAKLINYLKAYMEKEQVETIVVGKPMKLDGSSTHASEHVEKFLLLLHKTFPDMAVVSVDERFTSRMAVHALVEMGLKKKDRRKKGNIDQVSAVLILQTFMEMKNR
jgi:putative Holliday junction resolvase